MNMREKNYQISGIIVGLITLLSGVQTAQAAFFQNTFGLSDPHSTITFDEHVFPSGSGLTTQYADLGVNFSPFAYYAPYGGPNVSNFMPNGFAYPFSMIFSMSQTEAAFNLMTAYPATTTFYAYLGGTLVESDTVTTGSSLNDFFGFNGIVFDQISIQTTYANGITNSAGTGPLILDGLQLATANPVPIPATIWLFGSALAGMVGFGRRKGF